MQTSYEAILNGDRLEWSNGGPKTTQGVRVRVTVLDPVLDETPEERRARGKAMADALRRLGELGTFKDITDPVAWQREIRKDRPLPGREEE